MLASHFRGVLAMVLLALLLSAPAAGQGVAVDVGSLEHRAAVFRETASGRVHAGVGWMHQASVSRLIVRVERPVLHQREGFALELAAEAGPLLAIDDTVDFGGRLLLEGLPAFYRPRWSVFLGPRLDAAATLDPDWSRRLSPLGVLGVRVPAGPVTVQLSGAAGYSVGGDYRGSVRRAASIRLAWHPAAEG